MSRQTTAHLFAALESGSQAVAIHFEGRTLTWAELDERARSYAMALQQAGVGQGDRVAVIAETCLEVVIALFGNYYLGAVHVPINTRYLAAEIAHVLTDSAPSAVIGDSDHAARIDEALELAALETPPIRIGVDDDAPGFHFTELLAAAPGDYLRPRDEDLALIIYTSGTTGPSKGAMLSHAAVLANTRALTGLWACSPRDRLLLCLPLFHVHGLCVGLHGAVIQQMTVLLERRFTPTQVIERFGPGEANEANVFYGVPTMYSALIEQLQGDFDSCRRLARARLFVSGSAPLSTALWDRFVELTDQRILERYGMTETLITLSNPYVGVRRPGSVGQPVPGCDAAIVDEQGNELAPGETGELIVHSNGIMLGYWNNPARKREPFVTDREGERWFRTGDIGYEDEFGYFHIIGRDSVDIVKSGGFKIATRELEDVLVSHPAVHEVAIVGIPDETWGEAIVACVVPSATAPVDAETLLAELVAHHQTRLADFKKPRALLVCEVLPRNALGKLQKHLLIDRLLASGPTARR